MMPIFFFLISLAFAESGDIRTLTDKSFTRDNSFCQVGKTRLKFQLRSEAATTEPREKRYGSYLFIYPKEAPELLPLNKDKLSSYRFFQGKDSLCSKSLAFEVDKNKLAILLLKENRPYTDKLTILLFNKHKLVHEQILETEFKTDHAEPIEGGFAFRVVGDKEDIEMGKVKIRGEDFSFHDREFNIWMKYSTKGFSVLAPLTFEKFRWKNLFKGQKDFFRAAGWNKKEKKFTKNFLYIAFNHKLKKECILFSDKKNRPLENETNWHCNDLIAQSR